MSKLEPRKCCDRQAKYTIRYDCGPAGDQELNICAYHYNSHEVFRRNIKAMEEIGNEN